MARPSTWTAAKFPCFESAAPKSISATGHLPLGAHSCLNASLSRFGLHKPNRKGNLMKPNHKLVLVMLAGIALGGAGATAIHAQQAKVAPGYVVSEVEVTDTAAFAKYAAAVPGTLAPFNGQYVIRAGKISPVEGDPPKQRFIVIAFDSVEKARAWEDSPAYEAIKPIRHASAKSRIFIAEGVAPQ
jgi:uncharacterized protein (DUF1330 family)